VIVWRKFVTSVKASGTVRVIEILLGLIAIDILED